jgi:hypothetical protein
VERAHLRSAKRKEIDAIRLIAKFHARPFEEYVFTSCEGRQVFSGTASRALNRARLASVKFTSRF